MSIRVIPERCTGCKLCVEACAFGAITVLAGKAEIDLAKCDLCGACVPACKRFRAIELIREEVPAAREREYRGVWVFAEQRNGVIADVTFELLSEGRRLANQLGEPLCSVLLGDQVERGARDLIHYGTERVYMAQSPELGVFLEGTYTRVLAALVKEHKPNVILLGATLIGRSLGPRVAARLATGLTADCTGLEIDPDSKDLLQTRPAWGGSLMATILCPSHRPQMATVRPKVFPKAERDVSRVGEIVKYDYGGQALGGRAELLEVVAAAAEAANLSQADIIVSGGLGVGRPENFRLIEELADVLGGAVGASRAAVDAGWVAYAHQVGQTGRTVRPRLYIACGIRGAIQHLVGMQSSEVIVAVNNDPRAPIFDVAHYGIVGDALEILPALTTKIKQIRAQEPGLPLPREPQSPKPRPAPLAEA